MNSISRPRIKNIFLLLSLLLFVWGVNFSIISFDLMYPEQPLIYLANQNIHSFNDLLQIYLHPKMFHLSILFFRPSGHFLMYQLLKPFLGWQNTKALIMVNLGFLALTGYVMIKLYQALFPRFKLGGYLAFSIYLMHPALMLSRLIILHFEFAHVFLVLLSLYFFVIFCKKYSRSTFVISQLPLCVIPAFAGMTQRERRNDIEKHRNDTEFKGKAELFFSLLFFSLAITFKEPALMLGPVLICYFCVTLYNNQKRFAFFQYLIKLKSSREIICLIAVLTLLLALYLSFQWPSLTHPMRTGLKAGAIWEAARKFFLITFGGQTDSLFSPPVWRNVVFPLLTQRVMVAFLFISMLASIFVFRSPSISKAYKKSLFFLYLSAFLFLVLPLSWAWGLPWHLGLSLVFISLIMGFSCEYAAHFFIKNKAIVDTLGLLFAVALGLTTIMVNHSNLKFISKQEGYELTLGHNAVFSPPKLGQDLNDESTIVVEDSLVHDSYLFGASIYPYAHTRLNKANLDANEEQGLGEIQGSLLLKQDPIYNGSLFHWAYLKPSLQEEIYPFQIEQMEAVPNIILYGWLQHYNNIFCLGYDKEANWHDRTALFKKRLLLEKNKRRLDLHEYDLFPAMALKGKLTNELTLSFPDYQFCQLQCDQNSQCKGFTYFSAGYSTQPVHKCFFYEELSTSNSEFCPACIGFYKKNHLS